MICSGDQKSINVVSGMDEEVRNFYDYTQNDFYLKQSPALKLTLDLCFYSWSCWSSFDDISYKMFSFLFNKEINEWKSWDGAF